MKRKRDLSYIRQKAREVTKATGVAHNVHHKRCVSRGGDDDESNLSIVPVKQHDNYHGLFSNLSPEAIAQVLTERWIPNDWELIARKKFKIT